MDLFTALAADANVDPAFARIFAKPGTEHLRATDADIAPVARQLFEKPEQTNLLIRRAAVASARRFEAESITGFGGIHERGSDRWRDVRDQEHADQLADERAERIEKGL